MATSACYCLRSHTDSSETTIEVDFKAICHELFAATRFILLNSCASNKRTTEHSIIPMLAILQFHYKGYR